MRYRVGASGCQLYFMKKLNQVRTLKKMEYFPKPLLTKKDCKSIIYNLNAVFECSHLESNQAPTDYESVALTE